MKRRMSAQERKLAIVKTALPLFARGGFAQTTTKELAKAAGVSEPLLYKHFPSKEALYAAIHDYTCGETDPLVRKLTELNPSTTTLVRLVYCLMRAMVLARPVGTTDFDTRFRLMLQSILEDGAYARLVFRNRFAAFCSLIESSLEAAISSGDVLRSSVSSANAVRFTHHVGAWMAMTHLPAKPVLDYKTRREELVHQATRFALRGMGMTDPALGAHYDGKAPELQFPEEW